MTDFDVLLKPDAPGYPAERRKWWAENRDSVRAHVRWAHGWLGDAGIADILQETQQRAHNSIEAFRKEPTEGGSNAPIEVRFLAWVKRTAYRVACDDVKDVKRRNEEEEDVELAGSSDATVIDEIDERKAALALLEGLNELRPWQRELVVYVKLDPRCQTTQMARDFASIPDDYPELRAYVRGLHEETAFGKEATADDRAKTEKNRRERLSAVVSRAVQQLQEHVERKLGGKGVLS